MYSTDCGDLYYCIAGTVGLEEEIMIRMLLKYGLFPLLLVASAWANTNEVNVYNWGEYIPDEVLQLFTKETGIQVNYSTYDSEEAVYAKLKANPDGGYDVVFPSANYVQEMAEEGMLHKIDKTLLPNLKNLNPSLLNEAFDPGNQYSIPFAWGTTSIVVNDQYYNPASVNNYSDLWQPRFGNQLLLVNDVRDVFGIALIDLGYSVNDANPEHIYQAYIRLKALVPNIKIYDADSAQQVYCDGDALAGLSESGDVSRAHDCNPHVQYVYTKGPLIGWMDNMVIPNVENAHKFINFILDPKVATMISEYNGFSTPNLTALKAMPKEMQDNQMFNPTPDDLKHLEIETYTGNKTRDLYLKYWEQLKLEG
jgi:spermidine/putrescine transport system substrate-binding protein